MSPPLLKARSVTWSVVAFLVTLLFGAVAQATAAPSVSYPSGTIQRYTTGSGVDIPFNAVDLASNNEVLIEAWSNQLRGHVREFQHTLKSPPWVVDSSYLDKLPAGDNFVRLRLRTSGKTVKIVSNLVRVTKGGTNEPQPIPTPAPTATWAGAPASYQLGSNTPVAFRVDGTLTGDLNVLARAQVGTTNIAAFTTTFSGTGPFVIPAAKMETLPAGTVRLELVVRRNTQAVATVAHTLTVVARPTTDPGNGGTTDPGNGGTTDPGNGGTTDPGNGGTTDPGNGGTTDPDPEPTDPTAPVGNAYLGINLSAASYYATHWQFADVMRMAKKTTEGTNGETIYRVFVDTDGHYPKGTYKPEYQGSGTVTITQGNGVRITVKGDVQNLKVWQPGYGPGEARARQQFNQVFLDRLKPFKILRFMDQLETNHSTRATWSQRTSTRVQIEEMVDLCNTLDADPWFCMPHMADDNYVREFAKLVKGRLESNRKIYLEYSNEVWNSQFKQYHWTRDTAGGGDLHAGWAKEMAKDFAIWREVFSDKPTRVVRVLAGQAATVYHAKKLAEKLGKGGFDAISCAHYIGYNSKTIPADASVDWFISALFDNLKNKAAPYWREHGALAAQYGVPLVGYEGGQHVTPDGKDQLWMANYYKAQRDPRMYDLYQEAMYQWEKAGGKSWVSFNHCEEIGKWGAWGHLEYQDQPLSSAHKYRAMLDYVKSTKRLEFTSVD